MAFRQFRPRYITEQELPGFGLPDATQQGNILSLVDGASQLVDEWCGRTDGNGIGSLVYTTYAERLLLQSPNRNITRVSFKPMAALTASVVNDLQASGAAGDANNYWTGAMASTITRPDTTLSPILSCSGRYGYARRGASAVFPDMNYGMNLLQLAALFGGPPGWTPVDVSAIDFAQDTGDVWVPAGLYLSQYTEIVITYTSGFDPRAMPQAIKQATAALVRNLLARGGGTTGLKSISGQGMVNVTFSDELIDSTVERWLMSYKSIVTL